MNYNSLYGKRLLILGGAEVHCKVVEAAKEMGIYTIVTDYLIGSPAKLIADESLMISILDVDSIVDWCKKNRIDGVINFCNDPAQKPYQVICERLNLPCYGTKEQFEILTDKVKFKQECIRNGIDVIKEFSESDVQSDKIKYPVLVKPNDSRGSRGQTVCYSKEELLKAIKKAKEESNSNTAIIEQFMGNHQDFVVTYFFVDGIPYLIRVDDRYTGSIDENLNRQCVGSIAPSKNLSLYMNNVNDSVVKMLMGLGLKNGPVYMQGFIDGKTVRFYDPGFRFPGGEYELLLKQVTGVDIIKSMVKFAITGSTGFGGELRNIYKLNGYHVAQLPIVGLPGRIAKFSGIEEISHLPEVVVVSKYYNEGDIIPDSGDVKQRIARISLVLTNNQSLEQSVKKVISILKVDNTRGESLLASMLSSSDLAEYK